MLLNGEKHQSLNKTMIFPITKIPPWVGDDQRQQ